MYSPVEQRGLPLVKEIFSSEIPKKVLHWKAIDLNHNMVDLNSIV
jgi:hypothetical protein